MGTSSGLGPVVVAALSEHGRLCAVAVERGQLGGHVLRYDGSESAVAALSPDVVELLPIALSVTGRTAVSARCPSGGACTLLVITEQNRARLYFHAAATFCAVLDRGAADRLRAALDALKPVTS
jgi:hypothetical protein